jgi:hypothetical protein
MLWAIRLLSTNPWVIIGVLGALTASHLGAFFYGSHVGSSVEQVACDKRVNAISAAIDEKNKEIARLNDAWQKAIAAVQDVYNADLAKAEAEQAALEKRITDYEQTLADTPDCRIDQSDLDRVRGK